MMTSAQVVETPVTITDNSSSQDYTHPDDQTTLLHVTPGSKRRKIWFNTKRVCVSPAGNRTPVSRVTGGDTHHYTTEDVTLYC